MGTNNKKKNLKSIKGLEKAHPYSRKATQMKRAILLESHSAEKDKLRTLPKKRIVDKLLWFKSRIIQANTEEMHELIKSYIDRNKLEIEELKKSWRQGRPKSKQLSLLEMIKEGDMKEYKVGFEMPDLREKAVFDILSTFEGDHNQVTRIKMVRLKID